MMRALTLTTAVALAGCSAATIDPCAGQAKACLGIQVQSTTIRSLDSVSVHLVEGTVNATKTTKSPAGGSFGLPVALAVVVDNVGATEIPVRVDLTGSLAGRVLGFATGMTTLAAGQHKTIVLSLTSTTTPGTDMANAGGDGGGATSDMGCGPTTCDDGNPCTNDSLTGSGCATSCTHTPVLDGTACMVSGTGTCVAGTCCTGCVKNGACQAGTTVAGACGNSGNDCVDCTTSGGSCAGGVCSGCGAASCTAEGRTCGASSCGYNCGGCPDQCLSGAVTHYVCTNKMCQSNGSGNCGLYATCANMNTCSASCSSDTDCVSTAWCDTSQAPHVCRAKGGKGAPCTAETTANNQCASGYVCSWRHDAASGYCVTTLCTACTAATTNGDCTDFIDFMLDPRSACTPHTQCRLGCAGRADIGYAPGGCDSGFAYGASYNHQRSCGTTSCSGGTTYGCGTGRYGAICGTDGSCMNYSSGPSDPCMDQTGCHGCKADGSDCDYSAAGVSCC
jgi:hypothetical protein